MVCGAIVGTIYLPAAHFACGYLPSIECDKLFSLKPLETLVIGYGLLVLLFTYVLPKTDGKHELRNSSGSALVRPRIANAIEIVVHLAMAAGVGAISTIAISLAFNKLAN
jgi:hypothetical protein